MTIFIDVTNVLQVKFITGIQRVVRNVVLQLANCSTDEIVLLCGNAVGDSFRLVDLDLFCKAFMNDNQLDKCDNLLLNSYLSPYDMKAGDVFFDLDSAWNSPFRRSSLLPILKSRGVKTAVYVYDIIPIRYPQFCHVNTVYQFMDYIGAYLLFGDLIITSTQTVLDDVMSLRNEVDSKNTFLGRYSWLGSNFIESKETINQNETLINSLNGKKYVLYVGTVEPRKNIGFLLNAFDHYLFDKDVCLVIAGRVGWNVEKLIERINNHSLIDEKLFFFSGLNDQDIDYLYRNASVVAFPTYDEGFGLPIVESIEKGTPVITTDKPVLREVGRDFVDYFGLNNENEFCDLVSKYVFDQNFRKARVSNLENYTRFTWNDTARKISAYLNELKPKNILVKKTIKQIVILTARPDAMGKTLQYIDKYMSFISEAVLCCPDKMKTEMLNCYNGRIKIRIITDSDALCGKALPDDHQARNTFLRACAIQGDELDDVFIMSDDDYRPLKSISLDYYVSDEKYNCYYCYDLDKWKAVEDNVTSYDIGMKKTAAFLKEKNLPTRQFSSHMPQVIDRDVYRQLLKTYPEALCAGLDEWSIYFNYLHAMYPKQTRLMVYQTISWPGYMSNWDMMYYPEEYYFENYYSELYEKGKIFEGVPDTYDENDQVYSREKIKRYHSEVLKYKKYRDIYSSYCESYSIENKEMPSFGVNIYDKKINIKIPQYVVFPAGGFLRVPFYIFRDNNKLKSPVILEYGLIADGKEDMLYKINKEIAFGCSEYRLPVYGNGKRGEATFRISVQVGKYRESASIKFICVDS